MFTVDTKLRIARYKILNNILFLNEMLFKFKKGESLFFLQSRRWNLHKSLWWVQKSFPVMETNSGFFSTGLNISPHSAIFGFLDGKLEHKFLLDQIVLSLKSYLYKAREKKFLILTYLKTISQKLEILKLIWKTITNTARNDQ